MSEAEPRANWLRSAIVLAGLLVAAGLAIAVASLHLPRTSRFGKLWAAHPVRLADRTLAEIGAAAAAGRPIPTGARAAMAKLAARAPLAPEPFLVEATIAQTAGDGPRAERLFEAARARDPRSAAARYFLADRYLQTGRTAAGLTELRALIRLVPEAPSNLVPGLVAYARTPGSTAQLRAFLRDTPEIAPLVLAGLAQDAANARLVLALAGTPPLAGGWQEVLVGALITSGDYGGARAAWQRLSGVSAATGLFNPDFTDIAAPPPFNWSLVSGEAGLVEPAEGGGLELVYYGRADAMLAGQTLLLAAGRYRLSMQVSGSPRRESLQWSLGCLGSEGKLLVLPIADSGVVSGTFAVPAGCRAQRLELRGKADESGGSSEVTIRRLALDVERGR